LVSAAHDILIGISAILPCIAAMNARSEDEYAATKLLRNRCEPK
jgi:hypothetical protein